MTPLEIRLLLDVYTSPRAPDEWGRHDIYVETIQAFFASNVLEPGTKADEGDHGLVLTDRGHAFIDALMCLPLPVAVWQIVHPPVSRVQSL